MHVVTNDEVVARDTFMKDATSIIEAGADNIAMHLRAKAMSARRLIAAAKDLAIVTRANGATLIVNERFDVALAAEADGVHLGASSMDVGAVRRRARAGMLIGYSAHAAAEAKRAEGDGADYVFLGTIWSSASHPGGQASGLQLVSDTRLGIPVIAIGGVTPVRAREAIASGANGVAVIAGVWDATDPAEAVKNFLEATRAE